MTKCVGIKSIVSKKGVKFYLAQVVNDSQSEDSNVVGSVVYEEFVTEDIVNDIAKIGFNVPIEFSYSRSNGKYYISNVKGV